MNLRLLEIFRVVAQEENMTSASKLLFISQPAISQAIAELEEELGVPLFDRRAGRIKLNEVGRKLLHKSIFLLDEMNSLKEEITQSFQHMEIHIGSSITYATAKLPKLLKKFEELYPTIKVKVSINNASTLEQKLLKGELDLCFLEGKIKHEQFHSIPVYEFPISWFCAKKHSFSTISSVPLDELLKENLLLREEGSALRETVDTFLNTHGYTAAPKWVSVNSGVIIEAVKENLGVSALPDVLLQPELKKKNIVTLDIDNLVISTPVQIVYYKDKVLIEPLKNLIELCNKKS
ncbi:LysR family transcriptional regulator [Breznakia pachnodae]|uniref:DNA-binding transcriptional LysR family regulator n=1 Tax=Breznakia pachnodae TaxID=265178 RepID=A0ABU0E483_9FIRM|nr:LysR family transcriptional regulator [Breznakia pachnodae]MDQ0361704.1 DNA-binding transcriptional LysR family regulator [Breznakia pachnodae]